MNWKERIEKVTHRDWVKAAVWGAVYVVFVVWVAWEDWASLGWLALLPVIVDAFTTKYINWGFWRKYKETNSTLYTICSWVDAIVFALVAVYFINLYFFQNYQIPSSSLEKSLRVGDFLFVSKMSYGARVPNTPLSMPLMQHTFPAWLGGSKSFIAHPQWEYKRLKGWDSPKKGDIVLFNFPAGDTVVLGHENPDYYTLCYQRDRLGDAAMKRYFGINSKDWERVVYRPVDRRENYVKRCVGEPGDSLEIVDNVVYVNGEKEADREGRQYNYYVVTDGHLFSKSYLDKVGISKEDREMLQPGVYLLPLTQAMKAELEKNSHVQMIQIQPEQEGGDVYPLGHNSWTRDNYGPIYIPKKGDQITITEDNYWLYKRIADAYEHQPIKVGEVYTFQMDYYWMMGDNRHKSADSRYWGFVPEDHIVGRPVFIWLSVEKDRPWLKGHIRWNRLGKSAWK